MPVKKPAFGSAASLGSFQQITFLLGSSMVGRGGRIRRIRGRIKNLRRRIAGKFDQLLIRG
jgi:hypothetical protein